MFAEGLIGDPSLADVTLQLGLRREEMGLNFGQASSAQPHPL